MQNFFLYILRCNDDSYYVGHTDNIDKRISEHKLGLCVYTKNKLPINIVHVEMFPLRESAFIAERKIKKWTRAKKEAYINGDWNLVSILAKKDFNKK